MRITKVDVIWSYLGYILRFFSGFLLLPLMLRILSSDELGVWYIFLAVGSMTQMLDMGFSPTITRNVSYAYAGTDSLVKEGLENNIGGVKKINYTLLAKIKKISQHIYLYISLLALILLLTFGTAYIYYITQSFEDNWYYIVAWCIYATGLFLNFFYSYWIYFINGIGLIRHGQKAAIISNLFYMVIAIVGLYAGGSIMAVATASLFNGVIIRLLCKYYLRKHINIPDIEISSEERKNFVKTIWFNAKKMGISAVGAYLILQANTLLASTFFDLATVASYGLTLQMINFALSLARIPFVTYLPMLNELRITADRDKFLRVMSTTFVLGSLIYWCCAGGILTLGNMMLTLLHSKTMLLPKALVAFMLLYLFLEYNHSNFATIITTRNEVPFVLPSILSGVGVVSIAVFNVLVLHMDICGLLLGQCLGQLAYSNWHWPLVVLREFSITPYFILHTGIKCLLSKIKGSQTV